MQIFEFYILKGHSINELMNLTFMEKMLYRHAYERYCMEVNKLGQKN